MSIRERLSGNEAVAWAMRQINPDVFAAFPITPSTEIPQYFAQYVADGKVDTEYVTVESEHSSMSTCIGAAAAGARAVTATSSAGLAFMYEVLYVAASSRLPITLAVVNRTLTGPININNDHSDSMGARDSGWIQLYAENNQEAYDNYLQAMRISETPDVRLPIMICQDGFITSHAVENILLEEDDAVKKFVGEYEPEHALIGRDHPLAVGPYDTCPFCMEHKVQQAEAMKNAKRAVLEVAADFERTFGRHYGFFEKYRLEDAEVALVLIGSTAGTAKACIDELRKEGVKAGLLKVRMFRPFPAEEIAAALSHVKAIAVMDKSEGFSGEGGPLFAEVRSACYDLETRPRMINVVYGLAGRDCAVEDIRRVYSHLLEILRTGVTGPLYIHMGQRSSADELLAPADIAGHAGKKGE